MKRTGILKFGGAAFATTDAYHRVVEIVQERARCYDQVIVVVSAMKGVTDHLEELAKEVNPTLPQREYDMLVSVGERISGSLLAMAFAKKNIEAISFTGSQAGIITSEHHRDARIVDVRPHRLIPHLNQGKIVIVAGFQGVSTLGEITTLGRGGSDTTAVALGAAFHATVEFYKDVEGIYEEDPKKKPGARLVKSLSYDRALEIVKNGRGVLHPRSVILAKKNTLKLSVRSFNCDIREPGSVIQDDGDATVKEEPQYETVDC